MRQVVDLGEEAVCRAWEEGRVASPLVRSVDGRRFVVIFPGRRQRGPGPDFRDARFATESGELITGDLEVHRLAADWAAHGHDRNPAYLSVRFHLVTRAGPALAPAGLITFTFEPGRTPLPGWGEPCRDAARRLALEDLQTILRAAGSERFRGKVVRARTLILLFGREEALYRLLARAFGYGLPGAGFGLLGTKLSWAALQAELRRLSETSRAPEAYRALAAALGPSGRPGGPVRPANRAEVRLRQLGSLLATLANGGLWAVFERALAGPAPFGALVDCLRSRVPGLGVERARVVVINAVLPTLGAWAELTGDGGAAARVQAAWDSGPALGPNFITRYLLDRVWQLPGPVRAAEHQGAIHLYENLCRPGRCGSCPVAERLRRIL